MNRQIGGVEILSLQTKPIQQNAQIKSTFNNYFTFLAKKHH